MAKERGGIAIVIVGTPGRRYEERKEVICSSRKWKDGGF
jgi:hypothetical protein